MNKAIYTSLAAAAALALSAGAYAQNNTLATPSVVSPAAAQTAPAPATSGYGTPGTANSDAGSSNSRMQQNATPATPAFGVNNTLARPSTTSPAAN
jgi:hypothetical protein